MGQIDDNGYERGNLKHSNLIHRQIAYRYIYALNRDKYPLPFSEYVVHHKDGKKKNNDVSNLEILTPEEHKAVHKIMNKLDNSFFSNVGDSYYRNIDSSKIDSIKRKNWVNNSSYDDRDNYRHYLIIFFILVVIIWLIIFLTTT